MWITKAKERAIKKANAELYAKAEKELKAWSRGNGYNWHNYRHLDLPVKLRVDLQKANEDCNITRHMIETSKGARVQYDAGKVLYKLIQAGKDIKGHDIDGYTVISVNGTLKIGCHMIEMSEVQRFAKKEGWI